jgi:short-subunit dehydrogenase
MNRFLTSYWSNKSVLITGASSGLGWALAHALAPYKVHLCLLARREKELQILAGQLRKSGSTSWIRSCDVRDREQVESAIRDFVKETGRLDVAWVNSGIGGETSRNKWDWDFVERMIDTNLKGALYTAQACLEVMTRQKRGTIVGICSAASMRGLPARSIYSAGKIAFTYYLEALATEYPELQITTIHPGFVDTAINRGNPNRLFLMQPEPAAELMIKAVAKKKRVFIFPWQMKIVYHLVHALPYAIYKPLARRMVHLSRPMSTAQNKS